MQRVCKFLMVMCLLLGGQRAMAQLAVELKGGYDYHMLSNTGDLDNVNQASFGSSFPKADKITGFHGDLYLVTTMMLGFGVRYETLSGKWSGNGFEETLTASRTSLLVGYRIFNSPQYLGLLGSYGVAHDMKMKFSVPNQTWQDGVPSGSYSSYSIGIEGGMKFGTFLVGAEIGYLSFVGKEIKQGSTQITTTSGKKLDGDLTSTYGKAVVGVYF